MFLMVFLMQKYHHGRDWKENSCKGEKQHHPGKACSHSHEPGMRYPLAEDPDQPRFLINVDGVEEGERYRLVFPFNTFDSRRIRIQTMALPVLKRGRAVKAVTTTMNNTERKLRKRELEQKLFSLRATISNIIQPQLPPILAKNLSVKTEIAVEVPDNLTGDQPRLKQILFKLLGNAVKFTNHGTITVSAVICDRQAESALLKIGITDSGIGIRPETSKTALQPCTQADAATTRQHRGTDPDLSICARLAEMMGGRIWAESTEGVGCTFYVQIPVSVNETGEERDDGTKSDTLLSLWEGPSLKILLVDDYEVNVKIGAQILQRVGHTVIQAKDGREAVHKWRQGAFDVILMDIQMPGMNGIEAVKAIRKREKETGGHVPIVALTARATRQERDEILGSGFDGYIGKPFEFGVLFEEIHRCRANIIQQGTRQDDALPPLTEAVKAAVDKAQIGELLDEIESLLYGKNMAAIDKVSELTSILPVTISLTALRHKVIQRDLDGALTCVREIYQEFGINRRTGGHHQQTDNPHRQ